MVSGPAALKWLEAVVPSSRPSLCACCLVAVVLLLSLFPGSVVAQEVPFDTSPGDHSFSAFGQCFNDSASAEIDTQTAEPAAPANGSGLAFLDPEAFLVESWKCSLDYANDVFVPVSKRILLSLGIVMLVWYGIQHMLGRGFNLASLLNYFMLIGFAFIVLDNYYRPTHNLFPPQYGFVQVIAQQVLTWSQDIYRTTEVEFDRAIASTRRILDDGAAGSQFQQENDPDEADDVSLSDRFQASIDRVDRDAERGVFDRIFNRLGEFFVSVMVGFMQRFIGLVLWIIRWILVGQYMWGLFMLSLLSLVGPLFVPAILIPQVDWLFWNWLRGLFSACVYMLTSAALYSVSMILLLTPLSRINATAYAFKDPEAGLGAALIWLGVGFLEYIPIFFLVAYMSLQAGNLSSSLMSGSGPSSLSMAVSALKRGVSYTAGALPIVASGVAQRGAKAGVAGLGAYRWLRTVGPGGGRPGDPSAGDGGGGEPDSGDPSPAGASGGPGGSGGPAFVPSTASAGPGGMPGAGPGLSPAARAALAAQLTMETNSFLDSRVADRLADMGHPSVGGGAVDRLRDAERARPFTATRGPDGTYAVDGQRAEVPVDQDPRAQQYASQAARVAALHHVLLWDDVVRHQPTGAAEIGPAGDPGGAAASADQAAQAAAAAAAASAGSSGASSGPGVFGRMRGVRDAVDDALRPRGKTIHELGADFDSRVGDAAAQRRDQAFDWVRRNARKRWNDYRDN